MLYENDFVAYTSSYYENDFVLADLVERNAVMDLLKHGSKVLAFGELMMRLSPRDHLRL